MKRTVQVELMKCKLFSIIFLTICSTAIVLTDELNNVAETKKAHDELIAYLQPAVDPCTDFYEFACGNWNNTNAINTAKNEIITDLNERLSKSMGQKLTTILQAPIDDKVDTKAEKKMKMFYESCLKFTHDGEAYEDQLLTLLKEFGEVPFLAHNDNNEWNEKNFDWLQTIAKISHTYDKAIIIDAYMWQDFQNNTEQRIYFERPPMLLGSKAMYFDDINEEFRNDTITDIQQDLEYLLLIGEELAVKTAQEIFNFEAELAKGLPEDNLNVFLEDEALLTTIDEMQAKYATTLDIKKYVNIRFGKLITEPVYDVLELYARNLEKVIEKTPKYIVANYIYYNLLSDFAYYSSQNTTLEERAPFCLTKLQNYFSNNFDNMIYRRNKQEASVEKQTFTMWQQLKSVFREQLLTNKFQWISEQTRQRAVEKLDAMKFEFNTYEHIDFDELFENLPVQSNDFFENLKAYYKWKAQRKLKAPYESPWSEEDFNSLSYRPSYIQVNNTILMPIAYRHAYYLWTAPTPMALVFGSLGSIIARQIIHGFDNYAAKYDKNGNWQLNQWSKASFNGLMERTECLSRQYNKYTANEHLLLHTEYQEENIADNGGLHLAYNAYLHWLTQTQTAQLDIIPNLNYTSKQLFFVGFAQLFCADVQPKYSRQLIEGSLVVPDNLRVIAALSNYAEFAKEFKCAANSKMNPSHKCEIY